MPGVLIIIFARMSDDSVLIALAGVLIFAEVLLLIFLYIRWYFSFISLVHTEKGVMMSFSESWNIVKGHWWRTFGIIIVISIVVNFALGLITTPISFGLMWGYFSQYFKMMATGGNTNDPKVMFDLLNKFGINIGIVLIISVLLHLMITPLFNVVMYFDLKVRKHVNQESVFGAGSNRVE